MYDIKSDCKFIWTHILKDFFASFPNHRDAIFAVVYSKIFEEDTEPLREIANEIIKIEECLKEHQLHSMSSSNWSEPPGWPGRMHKYYYYYRSVTRNNRLPLITGAHTRSVGPPADRRVMVLRRVDGQNHFTTSPNNLPKSLNNVLYFTIVTLSYVNSYGIGSIIPCENWHKHKCFHSTATAAWFTWERSPHEISLRGSPFPHHGTGTFELDCHTVSLAAGWNGLTFELNWKAALCMLANTGRETV